MLTTPHALVGAFLLLTTPNIPLACLLAFLSHFILDFFIPHWNPHLYSEMEKDKKISRQSLKIIILDALIANISLALIATKFFPLWNKIFLMWLGAFFAILPDLIEIPYYFFAWKNKLLARYVEFEHDHQSNGTFFWGIISQLLVIIAVFKSLLSL